MSKWRINIGRKQNWNKMFSTSYLTWRLFRKNAMLTCYSDEAHIVSNRNHVSQLYNNENEYDHVNLRIPNCVLDSSLLYSKPFKRDARSQINVRSWNLTLHRNSKNECNKIEPLISHLIFSLPDIRLLERFKTGHFKEKEKYHCV